MPKCAQGDLFDIGKSVSLCVPNLPRGDRSILAWILPYHPVGCSDRTCVLCVGSFYTLVFPPKPVLFIGAQKIRARFRRRMAEACTCVPARPPGISRKKGITPSYGGACIAMKRLCECGHYRGTMARGHRLEAFWNLMVVLV